MKVLICGEGPNDIGTINRWSIRKEAEVIQEGWLQPLLRKLTGKTPDFVIVPRSRLVSLPGRAERPPSLQGHGQKAFKAKQRAISDGCDMVVFMVDADTKDKKEWEAKRADIENAFSALPHAIKCVACIPMSTSESWLLADKEAWKRLGLKELHLLPKCPEEIWGKRSDPKAHHPHQVFARLCAKAGIEDNTDTRAQLMEHSDPKTIETSCPISFGSFASEATP